jgi:hypothetical protein
MLTLEPAPEGLESFTATLRIDQASSAKKFQGVWLARDDGDRWLIAYRPWGYWTPFADQRVTVTGATYTPRGQAVSATHFRVHSLRLAPGADAPWTELGPERTLRGTLSVERGASGSKMAEETWITFSREGGGGYQLANSIEVAGLLGAPVELVAREITRSPFVAHMPGPALWVLSIERATARAR